ncbi:MAG: penicillin acylase family protein [Flavobacteriaceae bacterium]|nr:penicillin acylase family protein [Flavobacteriaceae bacterium]|tara:strand:- start:15272 stop:17704 length:2433 start_codon:yes stop_codon:yes gene_type:complete
MKFLKSYLFLIIAFGLSCNEGFEDNVKYEEISINEINDVVEVLRDQWGVNHIYAQNQYDLFFSQGYLAAKDRLFQFEVWRRQATGTVAEILGEKELDRDIGARLFKFRGDIEEELNHYHPDGAKIIRAYVDGINKYITEINKTPDDLPLPFKILGIKPNIWTPEVVISRHQGLLGNIGAELQIGRAVALLGEDKVKELMWFHPKDPIITLDPKIDKELLFENILSPYYAFRKSLRFSENDITKDYKKNQTLAYQNEPINDSLSIGSNNWVVSGEKTEDGNTYMANDPHRRISVPSLRYMAHLISPNWNVIGGGEPEIPGISIGHNEFGSWGLTVFRTDGEDLYQYEINPNDSLEYKFHGKWRKMKIIKEIIPIKGNTPKEVKLKYTHHGPVTYFNKTKNIAFAVRCAWLEQGGSPYLASLRMNQAKNWEEFREACNYSNIPGENMIWADKKGNIGWQAVGIAPIRSNFSGLVPVLGNGDYEWEGYLPIIDKPNELNPSRGFIATANQNVTPKSYKYWNAIGFSWSDPYRGERVNEVLNQKTPLNMNIMKNLQVDVTSIPAKILIPLLNNISFNQKNSNIKEKLFDWDFKLEPNSVPAAIYVSWENEIKKLAHEKFVPEKAKGFITSIQLKKIIDWIVIPKKEFFGNNPILSRNNFLKESFVNAINNLEKNLGPKIINWQYGQEKFKHIAINHPLGKITDKETANKLNLGPLPRGGNSYTPGSTGGNNRQSSGATFRIIVNTGDWDSSIAANSPGQSGNPDSPFYSNLYQKWANDKYFPMYYSKEKIKSVTYKRSYLTPSKTKLLLHKISN